MFAIEGFERRAKGDKELAGVGVGTGIGHTEEEGLVVEHHKVLVGKLRTINGLAASPIALSKVTPLNHKVLHDTMERGTFVVERFAFGADATLTRAQAAKVLSRLRRHVIE
jgi:hypothetical protein